MLRESGIMFSLRSSAYFIAFVANIVFARILGVDAFTTYIYAISWLPVLQTISLLGMDNAILKFYPIYDVKKQWGKLASLSRSSVWMMTSFSILIACTFKILTTMYPVSVGNGEQDIATVFTILALSVPVLVYFSIQFALLRVLNKVMFGTFLQEILRPLLQLAVLVTLALIINDLSATHSIATYLTTMMVVVVFAQISITKHFPQQARVATAEPEWHSWAKVALPLFAVGSFQLIISSMDVLMLGYLVGTKEAGIYGVAARIAALGSFGFSAINLIIVPSLSRLHASQDRIGLQNKIKDASKLILLSGLGFTLFLTFASGFLLSMFGEEYVAARSILLVLLMGHLYISFAGTAGFVMAMTGHHNKVFWFTMMAAIQNVVLNYIFITKWGGHGAAVATVYTQIFSTTIMVLYLLKTTGLNTSFLPLQKFIRAGRPQ